MDTNDQLISWLRDAHAMELSTAAALQRHLTALQDHPDWRERIERHLRDTREHARRIEGCLAQLSATPSTVKDVTANFMGAVQGMATTLMPDDVVKNALMEYALEHFEIASYSALIAAAEDVGQLAIAHTCSELLREETQMALWLEEEIPKLARQFAQQSAAAT